MPPGLGFDRPAQPAPLVQALPAGPTKASAPPVCCWPRSVPRHRGGERTLRRWLINARAGTHQPPEPPPVPSARAITGWIVHYNTARPHRIRTCNPSPPACRLTLVEPRAVEASVQRVDGLGCPVPRTPPRRLNLRFTLPASLVGPLAPPPPWLARRHSSVPSTASNCGTCGTLHAFLGTCGFSCRSRDIELGLRILSVYIHLRDEVSLVF